MTTISRRFAVLLLIGLAGCARWERPSPLPPPEQGPVTVSAARVTPSGAGTMMVLHDVRITADSVIGWREGAADPSGLLRGSRTRTAVHRSEVLLFEPAVRSRWATIEAVALIAVVGYGLYYLEHIDI
jgi:hypothetical protein